MKTIPFISLEHINFSIREELEKAFQEVIESNYFVLGENLKQFEKEYANYNNTKYCVGVASGLDALVLSLTALGVEKGDEVIVPANTFIASLIAISKVGAIPVLIDVNKNDFNIDVEKVERLITKETKAIMAVNLYGQSAELLKLKKITKNHDLLLIEDNAQSQGAKTEGEITGSVGITGCTSFYPGKNLGAFGDGGAITTNDEKTYKKLLALRNYGSTKKYFHDIIGVNSRLDEMQAAFLRIKLRKMNEWNAERNKIAARYKKNLKEVLEIELPHTNLGNEHVYHLFVIKAKKRNELQSFLDQEGICTLIHYPIPCHLHKAYAFLNYKKGDFPTTEGLSEQILSLPMYIGLKNDDIDYVCNKLITFYQK